MSTCCNRCQTGPCQSKQAFCSIGRQAVSGHIGGSPLQGICQNEIIIKKFSRAIFNAILDYLSQTGDVGSLQDHPWSTPHTTKDFIYADDINKIQQGMGVVSVNSWKTFKKDDVIYAKDFIQLQNILNSLQLKTDVCDRCNSGCDDCNTREGSCCCDYD